MIALLAAMFVVYICVMDVRFGSLLLNIDNFLTVSGLLENITLFSTDLVLDLCNWTLINIVFWK